MNVLSCSIYIIRYKEKLPYSILTDLCMFFPFFTIFSGIL